MTVLNTLPSATPGEVSTDRRGRNLRRRQAIFNGGGTGLVPDDPAQLFAAHDALLLSRRRYPNTEDKLNE